MPIATGDGPAAKDLVQPPSSQPQAAHESWDDFEIEFDEEEHELLGLDDDGGDDRPRPPPLQRNASTVWDATFNFTNSIVGAGIIGLPYSFYRAGFVAGVTLLFALTYVVDWTVNLLIRDAKMAGKNSYQDLVWHCFGKRGYIAISVFQFIFAYGAMCAYAVIVGDTLPLVLSHLVADTNIFYPILASRRAMIALCTLFISLPLSMFRDISALAKTSAASLAAIVFIVISVLVAGPALPASDKGDAESLSFIRGGLFQAIGVISFAFVCHHNTFLIMGSLKKPTMDRFAIVTHLSTGLSLLSCLILACGGYLVFTNKTHANILNNFPADNTLINIARVAFGANMFLTFPLECFVCREVVYNYMYAHPSDAADSLGHVDVNERVDARTHIIVTSALSLSAMGIALWTCDLGFLLEITGGLAATVLAYILPAACYIKLASGPTFSRKKAAPLACIAFGGIVMVLSTGLAVGSMLEGGEKKQCAA
ncbi:transmembrane amino acid transporter protein-domain-containing protein [Geranomyces variabilis]|nr:transmembrane amino acid transporter protein-domain-containing protein [Geranomyces variabilis]KAJ3142204.1 hypothetical protein HDU90_004477 [Geranomyces variabilis]